MEKQHHWQFAGDNQQRETTNEINTGIRSGKSDVTLIHIKSEVSVHCIMGCMVQHFT